MLYNTIYRELILYSHDEMSDGRCCVVGLSVSEFLDEISVLFIIVCGMGGLSYKIFLSVWTFLKL